MNERLKKDARKSSELTDGYVEELIEVMNEQEAEIENLKKENEDLVIQIRDLKRENMDEYSKGYMDAQKEAAQEIREHYHPNS